MKIQTWLTRFLWFTAVAAMLVGTARIGFSQEASKTTASSGKEGHAAVAYDIEITEGVLTWTGAKRKDNASRVPATINNVVDLLRELYPEANFAASPALGSYVLSELKLRSSSVEATLSAIRVASESLVLWQVGSSAPALDPATGLPKTPSTQAGKTLYVLDLDHVSTPKQAALQVEAFNISTYLGGVGTADEQEKRMVQIEEMVQSTVKDYSDIVRASNNSKTKGVQIPSIRFHRGANLIVIIGEPEGVGVAAKVIGALPGARRSAASDANSPTEPLQQIENRIKQLQRDGNPASRR